MIGIMQKIRVTWCNWSILLFVLVYLIFCPGRVLAADGQMEIYTDYYVINGQGYAHYLSFSDKKEAAYAAALNNFAAQLPEDIQLYSLLAPTSAAYGVAPDYTCYFPNQQKLIARVQTQLDERFQHINIYDTLAAHSDEYLYFRTDHHWTARAGYLAYLELAKKLGLSPVDLQNYPLQDSGVDYLGSIYAATESDSLAVNPDRIYYYQLPAEVTYTYWNNNGQPFISKGLYKDWWLTQGNKYAFFMGGDLPYIKLQTQAGTGRRLAIIKDSYANTIIPFLTAHYDEIYVIDPRNSNFNALEIIEDNALKEVLFVNYTRVVCLPEFSQALLDLTTRRPTVIQPVVAQTSISPSTSK